MEHRTRQKGYSWLVMGIAVLVMLTTSGGILELGQVFQTGCGSSQLVTEEWVLGELPGRGKSCEYTFYGRAGATVSIAMVRTTRSIDPWLDLLDPGGYRVASNDNSFSPGGLDSLISRYTLRRTGTYRIVARDRTNRQTGGFQVYLQYKY
jgi:hypothetical protein